MRSSAFIGITTLLAALLLVLYGISALSPLEPERPAATNETVVTPLERPTVVFGNPYRGNRDAKVTIVEFGDYLCAPCAALESALKAVVNEHPDDVRVVWKDFPNTAAHAEALNAAVAARCAGLQERFWEYHDKLLENQLSINGTAYPIFAEQLGIDVSAFRQCLDEGRTRPIIERDFEEGQRLRIDATPYLFINDRRVSGAIDAASLRALVDSALSQPATPSP
jgi:protein-disulfide isomerase